MARVDFGELGRSGLKRWGGHVDDEFLRELSGRRGAQVYREMRDNDPAVGAILFSIQMLIRRVTWHVEPASETRSDQEAAEFLESCRHDMSHTWADMVGEILTMLPFGWSYMEIVYKLRQGESQDASRNSRYNDGRIGWRKIVLRAQDTLLRWEFDETGGIRGMWQSAPPDYRPVLIPIEKALLFRTTVEQNNPEGRSILRNAYRPWYYKKQFEIIEGIGVERDLAGLPAVKTPPEFNLDPSTEEGRQNLNAAKELVRNIRRDQQDGLVIPQGWEVQLLSAGGRRQFDISQIIWRKTVEIAMTVLADVLLLGHEKVGTYALAGVKRGLFAAALEAWLDGIVEVFNRHAIPRLFALNGFQGLSGLPRLAHGPVDVPELAELAEYINKIAGAQLLTPDADLENALRERAYLPRLPDDQVGKRAAVRKAGNPYGADIPPAIPPPAPRGLRWFRGTSLRGFRGTSSRFR